MKKKAEAFEKLLVIMDRLRAECPWDQTQTFETLRKLTIEETYELAGKTRAAISGFIKYLKKYEALSISNCKL